MPPPRLLFPTLAKYNVHKQLFRDCVAGLTVGALCVPQSMSYAGLAGLPVQNGLYSDLQIAYQAVGTSRHLVVGPVAIMSLLTFECLSKSADLVPLSVEWIVACSLLSLCVGVCQFALAALGLGSAISHSLSENTLQAFTACASLTIANTQLPGFSGGCWPPAGAAGKCWVEESGGQQLKTSAWQSWIVSAVSLVVLEGFRVLPHPIVQKLGALVVLVGGIGAVSWLGGGGGLQVDVVGAIPPGLPSSISPLFLSGGTGIVSLATAKRIALFTLPLSLIGFAESFAIAKAKPAASAASSTSSFAVEELELEANRELAALGLANCWTSLLGGYPVSGSFSRSAVNLQAGATSCVSALVAFALVMLVLGVFTPWLALLPKACVSCIVLSAILRLIDLSYVRQHLIAERRWKELGMYLTVFVLGLVGGVEAGLAAGFALDSAQRVWDRLKITTTSSKADKMSDEEEEGEFLQSMATQIA